MCSCVQDAMETTAQSEDKAIAEELLHFFVDANEKEAFAAMLFTCYDLIQPDVALEVRPPHSDGTGGNTLSPVRMPWPTPESGCERSADCERCRATTDTPFAHHRWLGYTASWTLCSHT
jgi:hypothetical protein